MPDPPASAPLRPLGRSGGTWPTGPGASRSPRREAGYSLRGGSLPPKNQSGTYQRVGIQIVLQPNPLTLGFSCPPHLQTNGFCGGF